MATSHMTKAELLQELEDTRKYAKDLEKQVEALDRFKKYEEMADEFKAMRDAFVNSGFTETQAHEMTMVILRESIHNALRSSNDGVVKSSGRYPWGFNPRGL